MKSEISFSDISFPSTSFAPTVVLPSLSEHIHTDLPTLLSAPRDTLCAVCGGAKCNSKEWRQADLPRASSSFHESDQFYRSRAGGRTRQVCLRNHPHADHRARGDLLREAGTVDGKRYGSQLSIDRFTTVFSAAST
ncbi:hypothetical protein PMAYCL1PPCAC_05615, partial [Pristionchus mayeri]